MKLKVLLLALFTAGFAVSIAVAASPAATDHKGKPTTSTSTDGSTTSASHEKGEGKGKRHNAEKKACKHGKKILVTGEFVAAGPGGFAMKYSHRRQQGRQGLEGQAGDRARRRQDEVQGQEARPGRSRRRRPRTRAGLRLQGRRRCRLAARPQGDQQAAQGRQGRWVDHDDHHDDGGDRDDRCVHDDRCHHDQRRDDDGAPSPLSDRIESTREGAARRPPSFPGTFPRSGRTSGRFLPITELLPLFRGGPPDALQDCSRHHHSRRRARLDCAGRRPSPRMPSPIEPGKTVPTPTPGQEARDKAKADRLAAIEAAKAARETARADRQAALEKIRAAVASELAKVNKGARLAHTGRSRRSSRPPARPRGRPAQRSPPVHRARPLARLRGLRTRRSGRTL